MKYRGLENGWVCDVGARVGGSLFLPEDFFFITFSSSSFLFFCFWDCFNRNVCENDL